MDLLDLKIDLSSVGPSSSTASTRSKRTSTAASATPNKVSTPNKTAEQEDAGSSKRQRVKTARRYSPSPEPTKKSRSSTGVSTAGRGRVVKRCNLSDLLNYIPKARCEFVLPADFFDSQNANKKVTRKSAIKTPTQSAQRNSTPKQNKQSSSTPLASPSVVAKLSKTKEKVEKVTVVDLKKKTPTKSTPKSVVEPEKQSVQKSVSAENNEAKEETPNKKTGRNRKSVVDPVVVEEKKEKNQEDAEESSKKETNKEDSRKSSVLEKTENVVNSENTARNNRRIRRKSAIDEKEKIEEKEKEEEKEEVKNKAGNEKEEKKDEKQVKTVEKEKKKEEIPHVEPVVKQSKPSASRSIRKVPTIKAKESSSTPNLSKKPEVSSPNPNSALAIKRRMGISKSSERRSLARKRTTESPAADVVAEEEEDLKLEDKKVEIIEEEVKEPEIVEPPVVLEEKHIEADIPTSSNAPQEPTPVPIPIVPKKKTVPIVPAVVQPVRSSNRRSKPNRIYGDDFDMDPSIKKVLESTMNRKSAEVEPKVDVEDFAKSQQVIPTPTPKPVVARPPTIRFGCLRGYRPSKKEFISGTVFEDGKEVIVNDIINDVLDKLMLDVCADGVAKHAFIATDYKKTKAGRREDNFEKRKIIEAKRLEIDMRTPKSKPLNLPSSSNYIPYENEENSTKRKRIPKVTSDDYLYGSSYGSQPKTPKETVSEGFDEKKIQDGRDFLAREFDMEMEQLMTEERVKMSATEKEKSEKKTKLPLSLDDYMIQRDVKNRPECGIKLMDDETNKNVATDSDDVFFYELLSDYPTTSSAATTMEVGQENAESDEEIDIGGPECLNSAQLLEEHVNIMLKCHGDSLAAADAIEKIMSRPTNSDGTDYKLANVIERAASEQPERIMRILIAVVDVIKSQYLLETTPSVKKYNIESSIFNSTNFNAQKLKNAFVMFDVPQRDAVCWVHAFLVEHLPVHFLAPYLVLLKHAKSMTSSYIGFVVKDKYKDSPTWKQVSKIILNHVSTKSFDPEADPIDRTIIRNCQSDVVFLLVTPVMSVGDFYNKPRAFEYLFRWLKLIGHPDSEFIKPNDENNDDSATIAEYTCDNLVDVICEKVRQKYQANSNCRIVLVGYGWTTFAAHFAANNVNGISAIISLGFPVVGKFGRRGGADDDILLNYCPTLFVVGAEGEHFNNVAMKDLRSSMLNTSGLVVVGHANDELIVPANILSKLGITQKVVFRLIFEKIIKFLELDDTHWERTKLFPMDLNNVLRIDPVICKGGEKTALIPSPSPSTLLTPSPAHLAMAQGAAPILAAARRATVAVGVDDFPRQMAQPILPKKRKIDYSQLTGSTNSPSVDARLKFKETLMKRVQVPEILPQRLSSDSNTTIERGDLRYRSQTLSGTGITPSSHSSSLRPSVIPQSRFAGGLSVSRGPPSKPSTPQPSPKESGLVDPASISLA
ncbi:unnamed protein product [Caenorhabditis angaria]|uniref:KANSL3 helical domain-containing protein n=1 Tax=Caenorhabditis angaria TaxID=860376 RepID=A0A9P1N922_9PELO|nr:unnamed protein product [Caenorhabditis angaria]